MKFYLGVHRPNWLALTAIPLMVSHNTLGSRRSFPRALGGWFLDSGGFTNIARDGDWLLSAKDYATNVRRIASDWMCEPAMLQRTGLAVAEHQRRTVANYLDLRSIAPDMPWVPVLQGWEPSDYHRHVEAYTTAGVDLTAVPLVGVGSVCRRQNTTVVDTMLQDLHRDGLRLHAFGFKTVGLSRVSHFLASSDSMAWSYAARRRPALVGHLHKNCANCLPFAEAWRDRLVLQINRWQQAPQAMGLAL